MGVTRSRSCHRLQVALTYKPSKLEKACQQDAVFILLDVAVWVFFKIPAAALFLITSLCGLAQGCKLSMVSSGLTLGW